MANEATKFTINGVQHDVMDVGARQLIASVQAALNAITSGDTTTAIKTFQEVIDFLEGVTDDATLVGKLNELRTLINGKYAKPTNGIPSSDLVQSVQDILSDVANKVDKETGKGLSTNDYTTEDKAKLGNLPTADQLTQQLGGKANDNAVVKSISVNGTAQTKDGNGNVNIEVEGGGLSKEDISVETQGDGTVDINVAGETYTINLNHTHENMAKLVVCEESDLPSTLDMGTIYAQVDDAETPTEIQSLWIAGLEFVGGGGAADDTSRLITPRDGLTLDFDGQSTIQLAVSGKNLLSDLSLTVTGDFTVTDGNNAAVSTIAATAANDGVMLSLTKGSNYYGGTLRIFSSEVDVTVTLERDIPLPTGYSLLEAVSPNSTILSLADTNIPILSSWRLVLRSITSNAQVVLCQNSSAVGRYFGIVGSGKWGLSSGTYIDGLSVTAKTEALVEFGESLSKLTIGDNVVTIAPATLTPYGGHGIELFGCSDGAAYYFSGYVYEIECVSGGLFHAFPAKRLSDDAVGLYDIENDVFYTGFFS